MAGNKYGVTYQVADFTQRLFPLRATPSWSGEFARSALAFLKFLDEAQGSNPRITLTFHAQDGLWIFLDGEAQLFVKPTQKYLVLHLFEENKLYGKLENQKRLFSQRIKVSYASGLWRIGCEEIRWLQNYMNQSWKASKAALSIQKDPSHPRYFPGVVRQHALTAFQASGRMCLGVAGRTKKHKVPPKARVEFDHILPYSKGGTSTLGNVQVLCLECNRIKSATAK